ncbi:MAG TPA: ribbon-helix-helix protein, CopG family [Thermodesulfobacteriota bacterium]|nr:ribbon-helix-helix protein, CopG family [Thermodesulfobacteriota bacterium]
MRETITISLPPALKKKLADATKREHTNQSDIVREALRQYFAREEFQRLRKLLLPEAEQQGIFTDEDVFKKVSRRSFSILTS